MKTHKYKYLKNINIFIYMLFSLIFLELFLNFMTVRYLDLKTTIIKLLFIITVSLIVYGISKLFEKKISFIMTFIIFFIITFIYASQIIYFDVFKTFYTFYSLLNSKQVFALKNTGVSSIFSNIPLLILIYIPFIIFLALYKKFIYKKNFKKSITSLSLALIIHLLTISLLYLSPRDNLSLFDFYFNNHEPNTTVENLGLLNYMRLDIKKNIFQKDLIVSEEIPQDLDNIIEENFYFSNHDSNIDKAQFNIMDIDFDSLIGEESDNEIKNMHKYFQSVTPTSKNDHTGRFKDYNLILLTAESFSHLIIDKDLTPTLYRMVNEGYNFENFYTPLWGVSTTDGEYVANTSLIPKSGVWSFKESSENNMYFSMGNMLKSKDYNTRAYHNHTYTFYDRDESHPNMGYDYKGLGSGLDVNPTWPESDLEMMQNSIPEYIKDDKFHTYYMTVSGHMLYNFDDNAMAIKNKDIVTNLPYSEPVKAYIAANIELDKALEYLLQELEEKKIADKTLIALSSDHHPYGLEDEEIEELAQKSLEDNFEIYKNTFIVYSKDMKAETIKKPASSLDILPTLLNLMGLEYDSRLLMGRDIFSNDDPLIIFLNRSFLTDRGRFNAKTKEFISNEDKKPDNKYIDHINNIINTKFYYSSKILEEDYYNILFKDR